MKRILSSITTLLLFLTLAAPAASSYGGGGMPPSVMLGRENVRIYAPSRMKKTVRKAKKAKREVKKNARSSRERKAPEGSLAPVETASVVIERFTFQPRTITVKIGTTVTWRNLDSVEHTVTGENGTGPQSDRLSKDETYSYTFTETGTFPYYCVPHPYMTGVVEVTP